MAIEGTEGRLCEMLRWVSTCSSNKDSRPYIPRYFGMIRSCSCATSSTFERTAVVEKALCHLIFLDTVLPTSMMVGSMWSLALLHCC
jgi:hypothetical protein